MTCSSCKEPETLTYYTIINNTKHNIEIKMYCFDRIDSLSLVKNESKEYCYSYRGVGEPEAFYVGDSIEVIFASISNLSRLKSI